MLKLPLLAYPDRVCRRRGAEPSTGVMVGGGGVRLARESVISRDEFFLAPWSEAPRTRRLPDYRRSN